MRPNAQRRGLRGQTSRSTTLGDRDPRHRRGAQELTRELDYGNALSPESGRLTIVVHPDSVGYIKVTPQGLQLDLVAIKAALALLP